MHRDRVHTPETFSQTNIPRVVYGRLGSRRAFPKSSWGSIILGVDMDPEAKAA